MLKYIILILSTLLGLTACSEDIAYRIEGKLSNLEDPVIYAVFENENRKIIDTVTCQPNGEFKIELNEGDFQTATLFLNNKLHWRDIFLEKGKKVKVTGDAQYPTLLHVKGGSRINEQLSDLRNSSESLWKEQMNLSNKIRKQSTSSIEETDLMSRLTNVNHQLEEEAVAYIKKNPNEAASLVLIHYFFTNSEDTRDVDELLALINPNLREHFVYKDLEEYSARAKRTSIGAEAPAFKVKNIQGKEIDLASIQDKYILLTFTAPWSEMNRTDDLYLNQIAHTYEKEKLAIIVVTLDDSSKYIRKMMKQDSIRWNLVTDSAGQASALIDLYNVSELPRCYLIDKDKKILLKTENNLEVRDTLDDLLEENE